MQSHALLLRLGGYVYLNCRHKLHSDFFNPYNYTAYYYKSIQVIRFSILFIIKIYSLRYLGLTVHGKILDGNKYDVYTRLSENITTSSSNIQTKSL